MPGPGQLAVDPVSGFFSATTWAPRLGSTARRRRMPCPVAPLKVAELPQTGRIGDDELPMPVADPAFHTHRPPTVRHPSSGRRD
jgi:hypothetical protein